MSDAQDSSTATNNAAVDTQNAEADAAANPAPEAPATPDAPANPDTPKDESGDKPDESKDQVVEYTFEMPEGVEVDETRLADFTAVAKELNLSQENAQKLVNIGIAREQQLLERHANMVKGWSDAVAADPELGTPENQATAKKVIDTFGTPELKSYLNTTGLGNHPELVKLALKVGKAMSEDSFVGGKGGNSPEPRSAEDILYGKS